MPAGGAREERIGQLLAQQGDVARHRGLAHAQLGGGLLDRSEPHDGGEGPQLRGGHARTLGT